MTEHDLQNQIRMALSDRDFCSFRTNVGKLLLPDGRWFDTGLPKGHPDLYAVRNGRIYYIEVKVKPNKPSKEQVHFLETMHDRYGCPGVVAYSVDDALKICEVI